MTSAKNPGRFAGFAVCTHVNPWLRPHLCSEQADGARKRNGDGHQHRTGKPGTDGTFSVRRRWQWKHRVDHQGLKPEVTSCFCGTTEVVPSHGGDSDISDMD